MWLWVLAAIISVLSLLLLYGHWQGNSFRRQGVRCLPIDFPFLGHMGNTILLREHFSDAVRRIYEAYPDQRYVGAYQFTKPLVMIRDLEMLKQIAIRDFDVFLDHASVMDERNEPLFGNHLFALRGQKWKDMRATLSPAFTSSKMRNMFEFVAECGQQMADFFVKEMELPDNKKRGLLEVEMKDAFTRYTNDVIASTAFGVKVDSLRDRENVFYRMGKEVSSFTGLKSAKFFGKLVIPRLMALLGVSMLTQEVSDFFRKLVNDSMKTREESHMVRADMIQLLMEAKKGSLIHEASDGTSTDDKEAGFATVEESTVGRTAVKRNWSDDEIVAQAILFFIAGFDTSASLLCFMAHELAINQDVQDRLREEVDELAAKNNGKVGYNDLQTMKYMDMVVSETLRLWPPAVLTDRKCNKPYILRPPCNMELKSYQLYENDGIWIPIYGIQHDPKYWPEPYKFDPERFSDANKSSIKQFSFIPFGIGPRNCIGSRFALMEIKAVIFHLLYKFEFTPIAKTQIPLKLSKSTFNMQAENGFWVGLKPRKFGETQTMKTSDEKH